ncbi:hypothetical protein J3459_013057 [Metarhizium acridum]|uniref:uncharacterized protein n=1 Tax=Metarhizium acridum TaxID=92637 RepID=UPI001C6C702F|nr:hypothetical protein J3458_020216 [Metarhizium acridum]KAG8417003.1 hypothetical protein J3459_013057 [Metarhizium acridum]
MCVFHADTRCAQTTAAVDSTASTNAPLPSKLISTPGRIRCDRQHTRARFSTPGNDGSSVADTLERNEQVEIVGGHDPPNGEVSAEVKIGGCFFWKTLGNIMFQYGK